MATHGTQQEAQKVRRHGTCPAQLSRRMLSNSTISAQNLCGESRTTTGERMFTQVVESTDPNCVGITLICTGIDTSALDMCVTTDRKVPGGCAVDIWVEIDPKRRKLFLSGHIRWSRPTANA